MKIEFSRKREGSSSTSRNGSSPRRAPYVGSSSSQEVVASAGQEAKDPSSEESLASQPAYHLLTNHEIKVY